MTDLKPKQEGWYQVRFRNIFKRDHLELNNLTREFVDWVFYDESSNSWDCKDCRKIGYYIVDIIKTETKQG